MATRAQLRLRIQSEIGLDTSAEQTLVDDWIYEAIQRILVDTRCRVAIATVALAAGVQDYDLDTDILQIQRLVDGDSIPLTEVSPEEIFQARRASSTTSATTYDYAIDGANLLMIHPLPSTAGTLTVYYVPRPVQMSADAHDSADAAYGGIPAEFSQMIEHYACFRAASYDDDSSSETGDKYMARYIQDLGRMRRSLNLKGARKLPRAQIPRRRRMPSDPSIVVR